MPGNSRRPPVSRFTDAELYLRGSETLLASWEAYACGRPARR
jgi:hypothetical protein